MVLTGVIWTIVGILFGRAPTEKDRLCSFFALNGIIFTSFVYLARPPTAAPASEVLRLSGLHDAEGERFDYTLCLRRWGEEWPEDSERPYYYGDWYLPLIEAGASMPEAMDIDK